MIKPKKLIDFGTQLTAAAAAIYTSPDPGDGTIIKRLTFQNQNTTNETVTVHLVESGGTAGVTNLFGEYVLTPDEPPLSIADIEGHIMAKGDTIQAFADTADKVNAFGSGVEMT